MPDAAGWIRVAGLDDLEPGSVLPIEAGGRKLAVCRLEDGKVCVIDNICTHAFALLSDGWLEDGSH